MAVKTIITEPNKLLRQISKPVESVGKEEQQLMNDMLDTMYDANGIGLAAIQICLLYTSPSPRDMRRSRMPSSA